VYGLTEAWQRSERRAQTQNRFAIFWYPSSKLAYAGRRGKRLGSIEVCLRVSSCNEFDRTAPMLPASVRKFDRTCIHRKAVASGRLRTKIWRRKICVGRMEYRYGNLLDLDQVTELYRASTLGERRPIDDPAIVHSMLEHANLVVTAWDGELLVGISRTLTDFAYVGYLADLAVRVSHQRQGIGVAMIQMTRERMGARSMLVLLAAPKAVDYYGRVGFKRHDSAWVLRAEEPLGGR